MTAEPPGRLGTPTPYLPRIRPQELALQNYIHNAIGPRLPPSEFLANSQVVLRIILKDSCDSFHRIESQEEAGAVFLSD